jgi:hypothetical protein
MPSKVALGIRNPTRHLAVGQCRKFFHERSMRFALVREAQCPKRLLRPNTEVLNSPVTKLMALKKYSMVRTETN